MDMQDTIVLEKRPRIENWSVRTEPNPYLPPELRSIRLNGDVTGHPLWPDQNLTTSAVQEVNGRIVRTFSREYELGEPSPEYVQWCKDNGCHVPTAECPILLKQSEESN